MSSKPPSSLALSVALSLCCGALASYAGGIVGSLSEADLRAALAGGGTVSFAVDGSFTLTNTLQITNSVTMDGTGHNVTISGGGAVRVLSVSPGANLVLSHLTISGGYANDRMGGGGLLNNGAVTISDCTFANNVSVSLTTVPVGTGGGAIKQLPTAGHLGITRSSFLQNTSRDLSGGAISCGTDTVPGGNGDIFVSDSTFYANSGFYGGGGVGLAGPLTRPVSFVNCTFAWNTNGAIDFGACTICAVGSVPTLANCLLAYTVGSTNAAGITDAGHNLCSDSSSAFNNPTSLTSTDPLLGPLGNYGGTTLTLPLLVGSPAVDAGDDSLAPATDQRGVARPVGAHSDIGAFEGTVLANQVQVGFTQPGYVVLAVPGAATIGIQRNGPLGASASVTLLAHSGTAIGGVDFVATNLNLTFTNLETEKIVNIAILGGHPDLTSTVLLTLTNPIGAALATPSAITLTIQSTIVDTNNTQVLSDFSDNALRLAMSAGGTIRFTNDGIITLTNTLVVDHAVLLDASGHSVSIQANNAFRLFSVMPLSSLALQSIVLTGGAAIGQDGDQLQKDGAPGYGGAVFVDHGSLTLSDCQLWTNVARGGAGVSASGYSGNGGDAAGGAVYLLGGTLNSTNSGFVGNTALAGPGGTNSTLSPDLSLTGVGGVAFGGAVFGSGSTLNCSNTVWGLNQVVGGMGGLAKSANINARSSGDALGGAVFQAGGTGTVVACDFKWNSGSSALTPGFFANGGNVQGGGICNSNGLFLVSDAKFVGNRATGGDTFHNGLPGAGQGGAIANFDQAAIRGSWFEDNIAAGGTQGGFGLGGAINNTGYLQLTDGLFDRNTAMGGIQGGTAFGGALANTGTLLLTNITATYSSAEGGYVGSWSAQPHGLGGGLYNSNGTVFGVNLTIANNSAVFHRNSTIGVASLTNGLGGGIFTTNGSATLLNTLLATNLHGANGLGPIIDAGHNISSDASCAFTAPGSMNNTDPVIGPLDEYGGATLTFALLAGSPAIDSGALAGAPDHDQRGHSRPYGNGVDIGAFESSPPYVVLGKVYGFTLTDEVAASDGTHNIVTTNHGQFLFSGLASGTHTFAVTNSDYLFIPASQDLSVGPDRLDLSFHAFRWQTLSPEAGSNGAAHLFMAGQVGKTWRIEASTNAIDWWSVSTNTVGSDDTLDYLLPASSSPAILYRAVTP
jgi:predicted outer membrane repeat protein